MALRTTDDKDSKLNPSQTDYDQRFNNTAKNLNDIESNGNIYTNSNDSSIRDLEDQFNAPSAIKPDYINNVQGSSDSKDKPRGIAFLKRKGPTGLIIAAVLGGGVGLGGLFGGPSLFIVNISEVLGHKLNSALTSLDDREVRMTKMKLTGAAESCSTSPASVICKETSLSASEIDGLEKSGISVLDSDGKPIDPASAKTRGKVTPTSFEYNKSGPVTPIEFVNKLDTDSTLLSNVDKGLSFDSEYATLSGETWNEASKSLGVSKQAPFDDTKVNTDEERLKAVQDKTKNGVSISDDNIKVVAGESTCGDHTCTVTEADNLNTQRARGLASVNSSETGTTKATTVVLNDVASGAETIGKNLGAAVSVDGIAQQACSFYGSVKAVGFLAKSVRMAQLARYAMIFMTTASMIKAGTATSGDVSYLGNTLTSSYTYKDVGGATISQTATDTTAYKNVAFGDKGNLDTLANQYLAGGGLVGAISGALNIVYGLIGGKDKANETCKFVNNPAVQAGGVVVGIAAWILPGTDVAMGVKEVASGILQVAIGGAELMLPGMLKDIVAGQLVDSKTVGAAAGDALVSGTGALMSTNAQFSGNAPLTPNQAVAYNDLQTQVATKYAARDRIAYSPLDGSNPNTFMGTIVTNLSQYSSMFSSFGTALTSSASILSGSANLLLSPTTKAASVSDYTTCQDPDYQTLGVATDQFCNIIRGIPVEYLNNAPEAPVINQQMSDAKQVDLTTGEPIPGSNYDNIVKYCIQREITTPLGDDDDNPAITSDGCFIKDQNTANYWIHYIDQNALYKMENGMDASKTTTSQTGAVNATKQALATQIINSPNVTYDDGDNPGYHIKDQIANIANGTSDGNSAPCQVNVNILKVLAAISVSHTITISDINRSCVHSRLISGNPGSPHVKGDAVDISRFDGVNTESPKLLDILDIAVPILPSGAVFGIVSGCKADGVGSSYKGFGVFDDPGSCGHLHIGVPDNSDPDFK